MALRKQTADTKADDDKQSKDAARRYDAEQDAVRAALGKDDAKREALTAARRKELAAEWEQAGYGARLSEPSEEADGYPYVEVDLFGGDLCGKIYDFGDRLVFGEPTAPIAESALTAAALAISQRAEWGGETKLIGTWHAGPPDDRARFAAACARVGVKVTNYNSPEATAILAAERAAKDGIRHDAQSYRAAKERILGNLPSDHPEGIRAWVDGSEDAPKRELMKLDGDVVAAAAFARKAEARGNRVIARNPAAAAAVRGQKADPEPAAKGGK